MTRTPENTENLRITVHLIDGGIYEKCDTTMKPFGDNERTVSVWINDTVRVIPMEQVRLITLHFDAPVNHTPPDHE